MELTLAKRKQPRCRSLGRHNLKFSKVLFLLKLQCNIIMKLSIEICKIAIMAGHCDWADVKIEPQNLVVYREESGGKNGRGGGAMAN
jgi:hypothetical protein